jgi:hypothetical protein
VGPYLYWRIRGIIEEVAYEWHLGYLGAIGLLKPMRDRLTPRLGTSSLLSLHVDVWRLIFWSWVSHMMEWGGALHLVVPCYMCIHSSRMAMTWLYLWCYKWVMLVLLVNGVFINLLLNHGVRGLQGIYFFASAQVANAGCMCSDYLFLALHLCVWLWQSSRVTNNVVT